MPLFAMYIPKFAESSLVLRLLLVVALLVALVVYARQRWGLLASTVCICGGLLVAVLPKMIMAIEDDLGGYGDLCREVNHSTLPDWFFIVFAYFDVGWGTAAVLLGSLGGWLSLELVGRFCKFRANQKLQQTGPA